MRAVRIAGWVGLGVVCILGALAAGLWVAGGPIVAWAIAHPVSGYLGRAMRVAGPLEIDWGSPTRIVAEDVWVANAPWAKAKTMFRAQRVVVALYPLSLIAGPARVALLEADGAKLRLATSPEGVGNWKFSSAAPKHRRHFPILERFVVRGGALSWENGKTGAETKIGVSALDLDAPDPTAPVKISGSGSFQLLPLQFAATVGPLADLRNPAKPYPVTFWGALGSTNLTVEGSVAKPLDFAGLDLRLSLQGKQLKQLTDALALPFPALPPFRGTAKLRGGEGKYRLDALTMKLGQSDLEGGIAIDSNAKVPEVTANLTSSSIDLGDFAGAAGATPAHAPEAAKPPPADGRVLPATPIAIKKLPGIDAKVKFYGTRIRSPKGVPLERVAMDLSLQNGVLTLTPLRFHLAAGDVALDLHFTPWVKEAAPKLDADLDIRAIDLHKLFASAAYPAPLHETRGILGGYAHLRTTGVSLRQFLGRMDGEAGIFLEHGQFSLLLQKLAPIDVLESLGVLLTGDRPTPIDCFVSRFDIKKGVATADPLLFDTANTDVVGSGNVNFAAETLYLDLRPYNKTVAPFSLRTPIDVRGTFKKPAFALNPTGLLARLGAAVGLGFAFPPAAILPLIDTGLGPKNACARAFAKAPGAAKALEGSSAAPR
jgi:uncharacterized protein involved in outer membrane biogenesis